MKDQSKKQLAFTIIELLAVIGIIAILAVMAFPALAHAKPRAERATCANNLKQLGMAFETWSLSHGDAYPTVVSSSKGGPPNQPQIDNGVAAYLYQVYGVMSNQLSGPKVLACPADASTVVHSNLLIVANSTLNTPYGTGSPQPYSLCDINCSYFLGLNAGGTIPSMLLCGDRNIYGGGASPYANYTATQNNGYGDANHPTLANPGPAMVWMGTNFPAGASQNSPGWTGTMHQQAGNLLLCDGSVQQVDSPHLRNALSNSGDTTTVPGPNTLLFP